MSRYELLTGGARAEWGETGELLAAREEVTRHADRINLYLQELEAIGCVFKGFDAGLVDFYSLREDRPVFLCWRLGEERITHWHEVDAGFTGRQPIDAAILSATALVIRPGSSCTSWGSRCGSAARSPRWWRACGQAGRPRGPRRGRRGRRRRSRRC